MKTTCSIREVARHANVAASTVSRVLNNRMGDLRVARETREKIIAAARELNYTPNINAKRLFSNKTGIIGLLVPSYRKMKQHIFDDNHLTRILSGLEKGLGGRKYSLLLVFNDDDFIAEKRYLTLFRERNIDGLLIWGAYEDENFWIELAREGYPYLFLCNLPAGCEQLNYLTSDYEQAGYIATRHLLEKGHRHLVWLSGKTGISINRLHEDGIRKALAEYGLGWDALVIREGDYLYSTGTQIASELLDSNRKFTALLCANCNSASGATNEFRRRGIAVPGQIAVAACDSIRDLNREQTITRIETDDLKIGEIAAAHICALIDGDTGLVQICHPADFIPGITT